MEAIDYLKEVTKIKDYNPDLYRFFEKVVIDSKTDCWNWIGASSKFGHGRIRWEGKFEGTHRVAYLLFKGNIGELHVCHTCDNPKCVNPDHLFTGTHSDNMKDAYKKGRLKLPTGGMFKKGHESVNSSIDTDTVRLIKNELKRNELSMVRISNKYKVKYQAVRDIKGGRSYINV